MNQEQNQQRRQVGGERERYEPRHRAGHPSEHPRVAPSAESPELSMTRPARQLDTNGLAVPRGDRESNQYVRHVVEHAPIAEAAALVTRLYERYGTAFAIYLALDGVDTYIRDNGQGPGSTEIGNLERDFNEAYYAHFPNADALVEDTIDSFDWRADAERLLGDDPMLLTVLRFDHGAVDDFAREHYEVIEMTDGLYVFNR